MVWIDKNTRFLQNFIYTSTCSILKIKSSEKTGKQIPSLQHFALNLNFINFSATVLFTQGNLTGAYLLTL